MLSSRATSHVAGLVLGTERHQRVRTSQTLLALGVFMVCAAIQHLEVVVGLIDARESMALSAFNLGGALLFYALIRSGLNLRHAGDPSLTMPQMVFASTSICWSYAITGAARGAILSIMILVNLFGMFRLQPRQARLLAMTGFAGLALVMAWRSLGPGARYDATVELVHFVFAAIVMGATSVLSIRLGRLRRRLSAQKAELAQALELNRELATRDMLTGLLNRRAMIEMLAQEAPRQRRGGGAMALALLDIDWFKRINDRYGHQAGDAVLRRFADLARAEVRAGDAVARWGGEEFLVMMPCTTVEGAWLALSRLRQRVASTDFGAVAPGLRLSFSAGVSSCDDAQTCEQAIELADRALYRAKNAGRDRIEVAGKSSCEAEVAFDAVV